MPLQSSDNNSPVDDDSALGLKSARSSAIMREDDFFLNIVAADLDSFCAKYESNKNIDGARSPVMVFPSVDHRRRKLIHALISQRYQKLAHASVGVEPDRRPVAIYRDFLLKVVLPARFKLIQNGSSGMAYSEFALCLGLLEACRDSGEAKRLIERLYGFRLADQRISSPVLGTSSRFDSPQDSVSPVAAPASAVKGKIHAVKPGCERYVPRPMRLLQEQQRRAASEDKTSNSEKGDRLTRSSTADIITKEMKQKLRVSSLDSDSPPSDSPRSQTRNIPINNVTPLGGKSTSRSNSVSLKQSETKLQQQQRKLSVPSNDNSDVNLTAVHFLGDFVGRSTNVIHIPVERYSAYRSEPPPIDYEALTHVLEISGFPKEWRGADLQRLLPVATFIHWVDDTHILAVFKSPAEAKSFRPPPEFYVSVEIRSLKNATVESKYKAHRIFDDLVSRLRKPQTSTDVVRRVLNHHLRLGLLKQSQPVTATTTNTRNATSNMTPLTSPLVSGAARDT